MPPANIKRKKRAVKGSQQNVEEANELEEWKKSRQLQKPKDQLDLTDAELKEIIPKVLLSTDPQKPDSLIEFNYATGEFVLLPLPPNLVTVYRMVGTTVHMESEEAKRQCVEMGLDIEDLLLGEAEVVEEEEDELEVMLKRDGEEEGEELEGEGEVEGEGEERAEEEEKKEEEEEAVKKEEKPEDVEPEDDEGEDKVEQSPQKGQEKKKGGRPRKLVNSFNFSERAALTYNNPTRGQESQTLPPPMVVFSGQVLQWIIFDAYKEDFERQEREKELERLRQEASKATSIKQFGVKKVAGKSQLNEQIQARILECWKVLERMVNLNTYGDIAKDFRYWDDPSDEFREEEGTLLPLWKFNYDKTKKHTVTDIVWNPYYYDMFAVCYGFLDFMKPVPGGAVVLFTIKNPSYPDYICLTDCGVMCVDIHKKFPYMLVIGLYDGSVQVFNVQNNYSEPIYRSNRVNDQHRGVVWEVKWAPDLPDGELNFFSVATDGKVNHWVLMPSDLILTTLLHLYMERDPVPGPDGTLLKVKASASCVKLHPTKPIIYLVGTEEGLIFKCSTQYSSMYLMTYAAHQMPIHRIDFNRYNADIFISCSADWTIKIWEDNRPEPLYSFDVLDKVGDVKWAPYSSTVFAAVTQEGKVYVYDLNVNKYKPICVQAVVSKRRNKLTRISFNENLPIIMVGDDKGCVTTLKLSPNLRIPCKAPKKMEYLDQWTMQCMKLDRLLALVREPATLSLPQDTAGMEDD